MTRIIFGGGVIGRGNPADISVIMDTFGCVMGLLISEYSLNKVTLSGFSLYVIVSSI